jgi:hypothetical protein
MAGAVGATARREMIRGDGGTLVAPSHQFGGVFLSSFAIPHMK